MSQLMRRLEAVPTYAARSISRTISQQLGKGPYIGQVLAVFEQACNLVDEHGRVIALVTAQIGDGPLNVVLDGDSGLFTRVQPGTSVRLGTEKISGTDWRIDLTGAAIWESRPDWDALRSQRAAIASNLPSLLDLCLRLAPEGSLLVVLDAPKRTRPLPEAIWSRANEAAAAVCMGWEDGALRFREGVVALAGLGNGLTPSGDDFLSGVMLWTWLAHPHPEALCDIIVQLSAPRTTILSAVFLRAAARGECSAPWHKLLTVLGEDQDGEIESTLRRILAQGATSGADTLSGFLYMACSCST
jgi:hypothetical protein